MPITEKPQLKLRTSFITKSILLGTGLVLLGLGIIALFGSISQESVRPLIEEPKIWSAGVPATFSEVSGEERTQRFVFHEYKLNVKYGDQDMRPHEGRVEFDTFLTTLDQTRTPMVRYLAAQPEKFVLSWSRDAVVGRWLAFAFLLSFALLMGGWALVSGIKRFTKLLLARKCTRESQEIMLDVVSATELSNNGRPTGLKMDYTATSPEGIPIKGSETFTYKLKQAPRFANDGADTSRIVALQTPSRPGKVLVLRADYYPFVRLTGERQL